MLVNIESVCRPSDSTHFYISFVVCRFSKNAACGDTAICCFFSSIRTSERLFSLYLISPIHMNVLVVCYYVIVLTHIDDCIGRSSNNNINKNNIIFNSVQAEQKIKQMTEHVREMARLNYCI